SVLSLLVLLFFCSGSRANRHLHSFPTRRSSDLATDGGSLVSVRKPGMVRDVFHQYDIEMLQGKIAVGHNRYSTSGNRHAHLQPVDRKSTRLNSSHVKISYAVFCLKKKKKNK